MTRPLNKTLIALTLAMLSGCAGERTAPHEQSNSAPAPYEMPDEDKRLSFVWTAESGIDLVSGPVVVLRAYFESRKIVWPYSSGGAYPGYARAVKDAHLAVYPNDHDWFLQYEEHNERTHRGPDGRLRLRHFVGTIRAHVLSVEPLGADGYRMRYCYDDSHLAEEEKPDENPGVYIRSGSAGSDVVEIASTVPGAAFLNDQQGPRSAPAGDVFGDWRITQTGQGSSTEIREEDSECKAKAPGFPDSSRSAPANPDDPAFASLPPSPGWPKPGRS